MTQKFRLYKYEYVPVVAIYANNVTITAEQNDSHSQVINFYMGFYT